MHKYSRFFNLKKYFYTIINQNNNQSTMPTIPESKFKASSVNISDDIKINKKQGKQMYTNYDGSYFLIQTPKMYAPFGISGFKDDKDPNGRIDYSLDLSLEGISPEFKKELDQLVDVIISYMEKKSMELFKKKLTKTVLQEFYSPFIVHSKTKEGIVNDKYPPRWKTKIYKSDGNFNVTAFDVTEKVNGKYPQVHITEDNKDEVLPKGSHVQALLKLNVWVVDKKFGYRWTLEQLKIYRNSNRLTSYAFVDEDDEEPEELSLHDSGDEVEAEVENLTISEPDPEPTPRRRRRRDDD